MRVQIYLFDDRSRDAGSSVLRMRYDALLRGDKGIEGKEKTIENELSGGMYGIHRVTLIISTQVG